MDIRGPNNPPKPELLQKVARGSLITFVGIIIGKGLSFTIQVLITRIFGPKSFGQIVIGLTVIETLRVLASLGLPKGGMRFVSVSLGRNEPGNIIGIISTSICFPFIISVLIGAGVFLLAEKISLIWFHDLELVPIFKAFALSLPFVAILNVGLDLSRGFNTTWYAAITENLILPASRIMIFFLFLLMGQGFNSIIMAIIFSSIIGSLSILVFLNRQVAHIRKKGFLFLSLIKGLFAYSEKILLVSYSLPLFLTGLTAIIMHYADVIILGRFLDSGSVGIYVAASVVATLMPSLLIMSLNSIFGPVIATQFGGNHIENIRYLYKTTTRWLFYLSLPVAVGFIIARDSVMMIYGKSFTSEGPIILFILIIGQLVNCVTGGVGSLLIMTGHQNKELTTNGVAVLMNISLNIMLIPAFGVIGAAIATSFSHVVVNIIRFIIVYFIYAVQPFTKKLFGVFLLAMAMVSLSLSLNLYFPFIYLQIVTAAISIGIILLFIYLVVFLPEDKQMFKKLIMRIFSSRNILKNQRLSV